MTYPFDDPLAGTSAYPTYDYTPPAAASTPEPVSLAGYTSDGTPVYKYSDGTVRDDFGMIVPEGMYSPTGKFPSAGGGGSAPAPPRPSTDTPQLGPDGNYGYWRDDGYGTVTWEPLPPGVGPAPPSKQYLPQNNPDGTVTWLDPTSLNPVTTTGTPAQKFVQVNNPDGTTTFVDQSTIKSGTTLGQPQPIKRDTSFANIPFPDGKMHSVIIDTQTGEVIKDLGPQNEGAPDTKTFPDGSLRQYDPVAGKWELIAAAPPKDDTPMKIAQMQIAANAANAAAGRAFDAAENAAQRAFQAGENEKNRKSEEQQGMAGRKLTWDIEQGRLGQTAKDRQLEAAKAFAEMVNSVDPSALPAFLAAGGGNLGGGSLVNAAMTGANAITDAALLPAARTLGVARDVFTPSPYVDPLAPTGGLGAPAGGIGGNTRRTRPAEGGGDSEAPRTTSRLGATPTGGYMGARGWVPGRIKSRIGGTSAAFDPMKPLVFAATGLHGEITTPTTLVVGENQPEQVTVTPSTPVPAPLEPLPAIGAVPAPQEPFPAVSPTGLGSPHLLPPSTVATAPTTTTTPPPLGATGGVGGTTSPSSAPPAPRPAGWAGNPAMPAQTPADLALMDEVFRLRQSTPQLGDPDYIYRLDFWNQLPTWRKAYLLGLQAKLGVSAGDWEAEAQRMQPAGLSRESISTRY